ncbi:POTRA domain-containing protein [Croceimicrobium sp.]|uniref:translocation and assembly module lipoprotein TamL n=1 Tax=Croceimicrobium sp. TaxID=2828340 RepID=UPI003BAC7D50
MKRLIIWSLLLASLAGCKYSRYVPDDRYLLWRSEIILEDGGRADALAEGIIRQKPNRKFILPRLRPGLAIHSWGTGAEKNFWSRLGQAPVIFDQAKAERSAELLQLYYFNKGYFQARVKEEIEFRSPQKAMVKYRVVRGPRYRIDSIKYDLVPALERLRLASVDESELKEGQYYDLEKLDQERSRLKRLFRDNGYFDFSESYISFDADTNNRNGLHRVNIKMVVRGIPERAGDSIVYRMPKPYFIRNISVIPDFNFQSSLAPSDSISFQKYLIKYDSLAYKPRYLTDAIHFSQGDLFRQSVINETYSHYSSYNAFNVTEINYRTIKNDTGRSYLDIEIRLVPQDKRSFNTEMEVTNTSGNYGISGSVGIINRNLFKGGEALSFKINSGLEYQPTLANTENLSRTFELGAEVRIDFPRFVLPFNTLNLVPKRMQPRSSVSLYANRTARIEFDRETFGGRLSYQWNESAFKTHQVDLLNLSFSRLDSIDDYFISQLDPIQILAFNSEFISSSSWKYTYNGQQSVSQEYYDFFSSEVEIAGSLQSILANNFGKVNDAGTSRLFGAPVYQFARINLDYRYYIHPSPEQLYVFRLSGGYIHPYGLSQFEGANRTLRLPPFSRFFFIGGTNDLRAWPAYRAGGGQEQVSSYTDTSSNFAIGTFKLLSNIEYRFPMYGSLKGAVFLDAGNIWLTGGLESEQSKFELRNLARDLYLGSGLGFRLDLDFFVIRLDIGLRLRDPGYYSSREEWVIATKPVFNNLTYNIALGYPF